MYLVCSGYDFRTAVYDKAGEPLARAADEQSEVIYADIDLNRRLMWPWLGDWRSRIWLEGPARAAAVPAAARDAAAAAASPARPRR